MACENNTLIFTRFYAAEGKTMAPIRQLSRAVVATAMLALLPMSSPAEGQTALATSHAAQNQGQTKHRLVVQVNTNDPATMNIALNNAANVEQYYSAAGEKVEIEVVAFGPGLHMLRDDTSPVKDRIRAIAAKIPTISFKACANTRESMHTAEKKEIPLIREAIVVKSGVIRIMELQEQGWSYLRP